MKGNLLGCFRLVTLSLLGLCLLVIPGVTTAQINIGNNQPVNNGEAIYQRQVSVSFNQAQTAGNVNVVIVSWGDVSSSVETITDTNGNAYALAAGTVASAVSPLPADQGAASQAIYYAKNIVAGANTVTVTFNQFTTSQDIRILEYGVIGGAGVAPDPAFPLDVSIGAPANASPANSGTVTTTTADDVILGVGSTPGVFTHTVPACGTGCVMFGEPTGTGINNFGDLTEDVYVTAAGAYNAAGDFSGGVAVMQMAAFRATGQTIPAQSTPAITSIVPNTDTEAGGTSFTVNGSGFLTGGNVVFNAGAVSVSAVNCAVGGGGTTLTCLTPSFPMKNGSPVAADVVVSNPDLGTTTSASGFTFTGITPCSTSACTLVSTAGGSTNGGDPLNISGSNFAAGARVTVNGNLADDVQVVNPNYITAFVPAGSAGNPQVVVNNPSGTGGGGSPGTYSYGPGAGINFVQTNAAQSGSPISTVNVAYTLAQTVGDLNVVVIGWGDTSSSVVQVTDSLNNVYAIAAQPVKDVPDQLTQVIYYAKNIKAAAAGANTVMVTFSAAATSPDVRIAEYSGLDPVNPLDAAGGQMGNGPGLDSGAITTTSTGDICVGAGDVVGAITTPITPTSKSATVIVTSFGNNIQNYFPSGGRPNTCDATAEQTDLTVANPGWVMQAVAFRQPTGALPDFSVSATALSPAQVKPDSPATSTVTITPTNGFVLPVTLSCTVTPSGGTTPCAFNPNPVTPGAAAITSALTVTIATTGTYQVTVTGTNGGLVHSTNLNLTVTTTPQAGSFTMVANPTSASVSAGGSTQSTITITPTNGFTGTVNLSCSISTSNTPAPVCSLPSTVNVTSATAVTATLSITTTAATASLKRSNSLLYAMFLPLGMTLLGAGSLSRRKRVAMILLLCIALGGFVFMVACGGGSSSGGGGGNGGTPAGTYTVTVTGTATGVSTSPTATFTLTVQ